MTIFAHKQAPSEHHVRSHANEPSSHNLGSSPLPICIALSEIKQSENSCARLR